MSFCSPAASAPHRGNIGQPLHRFCRPNSGYCNPIRTQTWQKILISVNPRSEQMMCAYGKGRRLSYPYVFFIPVPAYKCFIIGQFIKTVIMLYLQAEPFKPCTRQQKFFSPFLHLFFHARKNGFFINKLYGKLCRIDFP